MCYSYHNESRPQVRVDFTAHAQQAIARADEVACDIARSPMDFRFQEKSGHAADIARGPDLTPIRTRKHTGQSRSPQGQQPL
jgi:hypothetical protein